MRWTNTVTNEYYINMCKLLFLTYFVSFTLLRFFIYCSIVLLGVLFINLNKIKFISLVSLFKSN